MRTFSFFPVAQQPKWGLRPPYFLCSYITHNQTHTAGTTLLNECPARCKSSYLHNAQQTQETHNHDISGIRTRDISNRAAAERPLTYSHGGRHKIVSATSNRELFYWWKHSDFCENQVLCFQPELNLT